MAGGLLTVCALALADAVLNRSLGSFLSFSFVVALSLYALLLCGLAGYLVPELPTMVLQLLQVSMGPVCSAMALVYMMRWLGDRADDPWITRIVFWGGGGMALTSVVLALFSLVADAQGFSLLLLVSAAGCVLTVVLCTVCALRAHALGDPLAIWIVPASVALTLSIVGLYGVNLVPDLIPTWLRATAAASTVAYLLTVTTLAVVRLREDKRLRRLAGLKMGADPATGLPMGAALLSKVDDAFWRAARMGSSCNVVCMHLHNLYALTDVAGQGVEQQISIAMSARVRRAVGFRCVVGLYHARCFVAVIQVPRPSGAAQIQNYVERLRHMISKPVQVLGHGQRYHEFRPHWGLSVISTDPENQDPNEVLRQAEEEAMHAGKNAWRERR